MLWQEPLCPAGGSQKKLTSSCRATCNRAKGRLQRRRRTLRTLKKKGTLKQTSTQIRVRHIMSCNTSGEERNLESLRRAQALMLTSLESLQASDTTELSDHELLWCSTEAEEPPDSLIGRTSATALGGAVRVVVAAGCHVALATALPVRPPGDGSAAAAGEGRRLWADHGGIRVWHAHADAAEDTHPLALDVGVGVSSNKA
mmetsp:Transcript_48275/g.114816  ORF Transcript_48275/g.114816 Transcript_48275/m.114816 type:complete len:201 (-) Transcript_48275:266-868(-)